MIDNSQEIYTRLGQHFSNWPIFNQHPLPQQTLDWLAEVQDLAEMTEYRPLVIELDISVKQLLTGIGENIPNIYVILRRIFLKLERQLPQSSQGGFILAGNVHDAMVEVGKVLGSASSDLLIIDPYFDETFLRDYAGQAPVHVRLRLLADAYKKFHKPAFKPSVDLWTEQYKTERPVEARLAAPRSLHDRLILVDQKDAFVLGQSFNQLAVRAPTSLVRANAVMAKEKIRAYEDMWKNATPL